MNLEFTGERYIPDGKTKSRMYLEHMARYRFATKYVKGKTVLDTGCGAGYGSAILKKAGAKKVVGVDIDPHTIKYAKSHYRLSDLEFKVMDCADLKFKDETFDVVVSFEVLEHIKNCSQYLAEIRRVLKPGGLLILSTPNRKFLPLRNPFHIKEFYFDELRDELEKYFSKINWYACEVSNPQFEEAEKRAIATIKLSELSHSFSLLSRLVPRKLKHFIFKKIIIPFPESFTKKEIETVPIKRNPAQARSFMPLCWKTS